MPVLMGLDIGSVRIGVAVTDETGQIAEPVDTINFRGRKQVLEELQKIVEARKVTVVVVGLPKTLKGETGAQAQKVVAHVEWFKEHLPLEWVLWDERLTTREVENLLLAADVSRARRREVRDQLAAQRILQSYVDHHGSSSSS